MLKRKMAVLLAFVLMISSFITPVSAREKKEDKIYYWKVYTTNIPKDRADSIEWLNPTNWGSSGYSWYYTWDLGYNSISFDTINGKNYVLGSDRVLMNNRKVGDTFYDIGSGNYNVHERNLMTKWTPLSKRTIKKITPFSSKDNHGFYNIDTSVLYAYIQIGYARSYDAEAFKEYELERYTHEYPKDYRTYYKRIYQEPTGDVNWINDDGFQEEQKRRSEENPGSQADKEKIKELENKISEKEGIISDLEKRTGESEKAVENLKKEISKLEKEISDLKGDKEKEIPALKEKLDNLNTEKDKIEKDLKNRDNLIGDLKREIEELKKEANGEAPELKDLSNKIDELKNKTDGLDSKNDKLKKDLEDANNKISDLKNRLDNEKDKDDDLEKGVTDKSNEVSNLEKELADAQDKTNNLNKKIKELEDKISNLPAGNTNEASDTQNELKKLKDEKAKLDNDANAKDKIIEDLKKEIEELKKLIGSKDPVPKDLEETANNLENKINDLNSKNDNIKKDLDEVGNKLSGLEKALNDKKNTPSPSDKEKEDLKRKLEESDKKIKDLNNKVDELNKRHPERDYAYDYFYFRNLDRRNYDLNRENQELQEKNKDLKKEIESLTERRELGPRTVKEDYVTVFGIKKDVYKTYLNSELLSQDEMVDNKGATAPFIKENRTMLPIRYVALSLGLDVHWDKETRIATFTNNGNNNVLKPSKVTINANTFEMRDKNGNIIQVDSNPILKDGRFYVSITNISKAFGGSHGTTTDGIKNTIEWDKENRKVLVYRYTK